MKNRQRGSKHNAITHGILASVLLSKPGSAEAEEFQHLVAMASEAIRPRNGLEVVFVETLAFELLKRSRVYVADLEIIPKLLARISESLDLKSGGFSMEILGDANEKDDRNLTIDSLVRYQVSISREIGRTLNQIQQLRRMTEIEISPLPEGSDESETQSSDAPPDLDPRT